MSRTAITTRPNFEVTIYLQDQEARDQGRKREHKKSGPRSNGSDRKTEDPFEIGESVVSAKPGLVPVEKEHRRKRQGLSNNREVDTFDPGAESKESENPGQQTWNQYDQQRCIPKVFGSVPVPRQRFPVQEDHEIGKVAMVDPLQSDRAHQVHAHHVTAERKEQAVSQAQDSAVAPD